MSGSGFNNDPLTGGGGNGDFFGPNSSVAGNFVSFADTSGKQGADSGFNAASFAPVTYNFAVTQANELLLDLSPVNATLRWQFNLGALEQPIIKTTSNGDNYIYGSSSIFVIDGTPISAQTNGAESFTSTASTICYLSGGQDTEGDSPDLSLNMDSIGDSCTIRAEIGQTVAGNPKAVVSGAIWVDASFQIVGSLTFYATTIT